MRWVVRNGRWLDSIQDRLPEVVTVASVQIHEDCNAELVEAHLTGPLWRVQLLDGATLRRVDLRPAGYEVVMPLSAPQGTQDCVVKDDEVGPCARPGVVPQWGTTPPPSAPRAPFNNSASHAHPLEPPPPPSPLSGPSANQRFSLAPSAAPLKTQHHRGEGGGGASSIRQLLGAADAQTAHQATFSTVPTHQILGSANAETTPAGAPAAAADRTQRPDATCEGKTG